MNRMIPRRRLLAAVAAVPAAGLFLSSCSNSEDEATTAETADTTTTASVDAPPPQGTVDMEKLLEPGALPDKSLGDRDAPVTIVEYASMTCSHCANFSNTTFPKLKEEYIDTGKVYFIMREFPFDPRAEAGFMLARCAADKYFPMVEVLFEKQENWAPVKNASEPLLQIAKLAGFTKESFEACLTDQTLLENIRAVRARGEEFGVDATPTFFINGKKYSGDMSIDQMSAIIDGML